MVLAQVVLEILRKNCRGGHNAPPPPILNRVNIHERSLTFDVLVIVLATFKTQSIIWELKFLLKDVTGSLWYFSIHRVIEWNRYRTWNCAQAILWFAFVFSGTVLCHCQSKLTYIAKILQTEKQEKKATSQRPTFKKKTIKSFFVKGKLLYFVECTKMSLVTIKFQTIFNWSESFFCISFSWEKMLYQAPEWIS